MAEIEDRLRNIQTRLSSATAQRTRDEIEIENAEKKVAEAKDSLKTEFGVVTSSELKEKRAELEATLEAEVSKAESLLAEAGA